MPDMIEPNIHPVLVHFTYALLTLSALSLFAVSLQPTGGWRDTLKSAGDWMLFFGAVAAIATVAAGFQAFYSVAHDGPSHAAMTTHRNFAVPTIVALLALALWRYKKRSQKPGVLFSALFLVATGFLAVTAWWGGRLVYHHGLGVEGMHEAETPGHHHEHGAGEEHGDAEEGSGGGAHEHGAGDEHPDTDHIPSPDATDLGTASDATAAADMAAQGLSSPAAVADAFASALKAGDAAAVEQLLLPDVLIAESGGAERSFAEYQSHHMPSDMEFMKAVETTVKDRRAFEAADMATVVTTSGMHGTFRGETVHSQSMETMVLTRVDGVWRIAHIHWSSAPVTAEHEH